MTKLSNTMAIYTCKDCSTKFEHDDLPRRGEYCFKCHLSGLRFGFTYGKEDFHGPTIGERARQQVAQAEAAGIKAEPVGSRWI